MKDKEKNKKFYLGQFYTSREIANFMVELSNKPITANVLETGFGNGIFIESLLKRGFKNIEGYDIDKENCKIVKNKFKNKIKIKCQDYLTSSREEKFDLIIGNPPYVHWNNIQENIRSRLSSDDFWKQYSNGEWDLLYAFIIWSIEKLNENGELIYIVPYNWFNSTYGASLRKYLINNGIFEIICHFGEFKLFKDCYPNNIIFKYKKTKQINDKPIFIADFKGRKGSTSEIVYFIKKELKKINNRSYEIHNKDFKIFTAPQFKSENLWYLATPTERKQIEKLEKNTKNIKLSDYLNIGVGIVSGYDEAYRVDNSQINSFLEKEKKFIFPFIKAENCKRFFVDNGSHYIFTENITTEKQLKKYPNIYTKLRKNKQKLNKRYMPKNKNWWSWATIRNRELFEENLNKPKIFVPCMDRSLKARYSYTSNGYFGSGDVLIIINKKNLKEDLVYILAWLNSEIINNWYRIKGSHTGQRIRYTQSYVSQIPLRLINWNDKKEVEIYNNIVKKTERIIKEKGNKKLEGEIEYLFEILI